MTIKIVVFGTETSRHVHLINVLIGKVIKPIMFTSSYTIYRFKHKYSSLIDIFDDEVNIDMWVIHHNMYNDTFIREVIRTADACIVVVSGCRKKTIDKINEIEYIKRIKLFVSYYDIQFVSILSTCSKLKLAPKYIIGFSNTSKYGPTIVDISTAWPGTWNNKNIIIPNNNITYITILEQHFKDIFNEICFNNFEKTIPINRDYEMNNIYTLYKSLNVEKKHIKYNRNFNHNSNYSLISNSVCCGDILFV